MCKDHYLEEHNKTLSYPQIFGVRMPGKYDVVLPAEICSIELGQMFKRKVPSDIMPKVLDFASKRPLDRLRAIEDAASGSVIFIPSSSRNSFKLRLCNRC